MHTRMQFVLPGGLDKRGRPVVVCRARLHDGNGDYLDTLSTVVYLFEKALRET